MGQNVAGNRWKRIGAGMYQLLGTPFAVHNMRGMSIKYSGIVLSPWVVYRGRKEIHAFGTKTEAQRYVEGLL